MTEPTTESKPDSFGSRLKAARTAAGLSQGKAAVLVNVSDSTIKNWEYDKTTPSPQKQGAVLRKLREATEVARESDAIDQTLADAEISEVPEDAQFDDGLAAPEGTNAPSGPAAPVEPRPKRAYRDPATRELTDADLAPTVPPVTQPATWTGPAAGPPTHVEVAPERPVAAHAPAAALADVGPVERNWAFWNS